MQFEHDHQVDGVAADLSLDEQSVGADDGIGGEGVHGALVQVGKQGPTSLIFSRAMPRTWRNAVRPGPPWAAMAVWWPGEPYQCRRE